MRPDNAVRAPESAYFLPAVPELPLNARLLYLRYIEGCGGVNKPLHPFAYFLVRRSGRQANGLQGPFGQGRQTEQQ